jgi:hypothetical protein
VLVVNRLTLPAPLVHVQWWAQARVVLEVFGLDETWRHWDMTSISLHGTYSQVDEKDAVPKFGYPTGRRPSGVTGRGSASAW